MSTDITKENRLVSITRPSSIQLPPLPAVNYPYYQHQVRKTRRNLFSYTSDCVFLLFYPIFKKHRPTFR